jgi:hypothetical protein
MRTCLVANLGKLGPPLITAATAPNRLRVPRFPAAINSLSQHKLSTRTPLMRTRLCTDEARQRRVQRTGPAGFGQ